MRRSLLVLALVFGACGDDDGGSFDASAADGAPAIDSAPAVDAAPDAAPPPTDLELLQMLVDALPGAPNDAARDMLVDEFSRAVSYGTNGFPIREGGKLAVIWRGEAGAWTVAGDFNAWDPAQWPLTQPVAGYPFWYAIVDVTEPLPRTLYKLVKDGADYRADPLARRYGYDSFGEYSLAEAGDAQSHLERWPQVADPHGVVAARDVIVYVPEKYLMVPTRTFPVLYLHDGQNVFDPAANFGGWHAQETADDRITTGAVRQFLMVAVPNSPARMDEYTHTPDDIGGGPIGGGADDYAYYLIDAVKPLVDARYRTKPGAADTGILGSSLGGLVSVYLAYAHPEIWGHAGSMSGTFGWGSIGAGVHNPTVMQLFDTISPVGVTFYLDSGGGPGSGCVDSDGDGVDDDTPDSGDNYCETVQMEDTLRTLGWSDGVDLITGFAPGAQHNEAAWAARFPDAIESWFPGP